MILLAFFNGDGDVGGFAALMANDRERPQALAIHIDGHEDGILDHDLEVPGALIEIADARFQVHVELGAIEGLVHNGHIEEPQRNGDRPGIVHRSNNLAIREGVIALEGDQADLDLRSFVNREYELDSIGRRDFLVGWLYHRELVAVFGLELLDGHFGFLNLGGIKLALDRKAYLAVLEAIENIRFGYGLDAVIFNAANDGTLDEIKGHNLLVGVTGFILDFEADVFEILGIPKGLKI